MASDKRMVLDGAVQMDLAKGTNGVIRITEAMWDALSDAPGKCPRTPTGDEEGVRRLSVHALLGSAKTSRAWIVPKSLVARLLNREAVLVTPQKFAQMTKLTTFVAEGEAPEDDCGGGGEAESEAVGIEQALEALMGSEVAPSAEHEDEHEDEDPDPRSRAQDDWLDEREGPEPEPDAPPPEVNERLPQNEMINVDLAIAYMDLSRYLKGLRHIPEVLKASAYCLNPSNPETGAEIARDIEEGRIWPPPSDHRMQVLH